VRTKTVLSEVGPVEIEDPRDRDASFDLVIVPMPARRLEGVDQIVLSLTARGLTTGELAAHFAEVYGATVSRDTIRRITDAVVEQMAAWQGRPPDRVYPVVWRGRDQGQGRGRAGHQPADLRRYRRDRQPRTRHPRVGKPAGSRSDVVGVRGRRRP